jgi:hypothetical protein
MAGRAHEMAIPNVEVAAYCAVGGAAVNYSK